MATKLVSQHQFNAGEISPKLDGRQDIRKDNAGLSTATNCYCLPQGPVARRAGFKYVAETKDSGEVRLVKFQFSNSDALVLEFGDEYIRFYKDEGQVLSGGSPYEIVSPYTIEQAQDFTYQQYGDYIYIAHPDVFPQLLKRNADDDWEIGDIGFDIQPSYEKGTTPTVSVTPAATTGTSVNFTASSSFWLLGDVGRDIVNLSGAGRAVIKSYTSATVVVCSIIEAFPSTSAITSSNWILDASGKAELKFTSYRSGTISTITAEVVGSSTSAINVFRSSDVGKYLLMFGGVAEIDSYTSGSSIEVRILKDFNETDTALKTAVWSIEDLQWNATRGYPRAVGLWQERLIFGSTVAKPQTIWMSEQGLFESFGTGPDNEDSIELDISASQVNFLNWFANSRDFVIGTSGSEITLTTRGSDGVTPTSVEQTPRTAIGSESQQPIVRGTETIYIQQSKRKIRSMYYDFNIDGYKPDDLTIYSDHLTSGLIKRIAYAQEPDSIIYAVTEDGDLLSCTYQREQEVLGWTRWETQGTFESIQTITAGETDQVWVVVNRNGGRYVELLETGDGTSITDGFMDSFLVYYDPITVQDFTALTPQVQVTTSTSHGFSTGDHVKIFDVENSSYEGKTYEITVDSATTFLLSDLDGNAIDGSEYGGIASGVGRVHKLVDTISGLDHLEGSVVQIKVDGAVHEDLSVNGGEINLSTECYAAVVGLEYETTIATRNKDFDLGLGSMQGQPVRWSRPIIRVLNSAIPMVDGEFLPSREAEDLLDSAVPLYTGDLYFSSLPFNTTGKLTFTISDPFPFMLLAIYGSIDAGIK